MTKVRLTITILLVLIITNTIVIDKSIQFIFYGAKFSESVGNILNKFSIFLLVESLFSLVILGLAYLAIKKTIDINLKEYIKKSKGMLLALVLYVMSIYIMHAEFHYTLAAQGAENSTAGISMMLFSPASATLVSLLFIVTSAFVFLKNTFFLQKNK